MARLSVNLNKIALLRNSRHTGVPDLLRFARLALEAGAQGLTVHPRPDERHIRASDVPLLGEMMRPRRPACEFNIEGYPDERLMAILRAERPEQATLIPDAPDAFTSEEGWKLDAAQTAFASHAVSAIRQLGCRVILFIDPDATVIQRARHRGRRRGDLHWPLRCRVPDGGHNPILRQIAATARAARAAGLVVNAGHDLNRRNIPPLDAGGALPGRGLDWPRTHRRRAGIWLAATVAAYVTALQ